MERSKPAHKGAVEALRRWKQTGYRVDPTNDKHLEAYLLARKDNPRPRIITLMNILKSHEVSITDSRSIKPEYTLVPCGNFPKGPPGWLAEFLYEPADITDVDVAVL